MEKKHLKLELLELSGPLPGGINAYQRIGVDNTIFKYHPMPLVRNPTPQKLHGLVLDNTMVPDGNWNMGHCKPSSGKGYFLATVENRQLAKIDQLWHPERVGCSELLDKHLSVD
jgi:hypothetical protein